ncbi:unnamed protein product [Phytomonas sp. EM1]|nr:unnamed protein product [Phytomonas sp. EM1]|eukprot:CCW60219.1 unnamed protein product [Phytomonas sp. isolate EM1]
MREQINMLTSMRLRDYVEKAYFISFFFTVSMVVWSFFTGLTGSEHGAVVVISGSMEPGYRRGDFITVHRRPSSEVRAGDIIVYRLEGREIPIVHRVITWHRREIDGKQFYLTKGDNNHWNDRALYDSAMEFISGEAIVGKVFAKLSFFGYATIMFNEVAIVKYISMGLIGFFLITSMD